MRSWELQRASFEFESRLGCGRGLAGRAGPTLRAPQVFISVCKGCRPLPTAVPGPGDLGQERREGASQAASDFLWLPLLHLAAAQSGLRQGLQWTLVEFAHRDCVAGADVLALGTARASENASSHFQCSRYRGRSRKPWRWGFSVTELHWGRVSCLCSWFCRRID